ncbi:MAG: hypothetical protein B9S36_01240 [Verrucomicrobiia bacterium Tous-C2TDCM]|nr:MAG: hypothetical protein B9S36_01240 [Verrucomicrobiae bacterium Tous-C2TDCM]
MPAQRPNISKPAPPKTSPTVISRGYTVAPKPVPKPVPKLSLKPDQKPTAKPLPSVATRGSSIGARGSVPSPVSRPSVKPAPKPAPKPSPQVARKPQGGGGGDQPKHPDHRNVRASRPVAPQGGSDRAANPGKSEEKVVGSRIAKEVGDDNRPGEGKGGGGRGDQGGGGNAGNGGDQKREASRPSRISTLASRGTPNHHRRIGIYNADEAEPRSAGGGGMGGYRVGDSAGGGGYGVWRYASYEPHHSDWVSPNFCHSVNYAYRPSVWGHRPWWGARYHYSWHNGCWDYGWDRGWTSRYAYYRRPALYYPPGYGTYYSTPATFVPWGLASWTLGRLAYDTGYYSYHNPYVAPPVHTSTTVIRYVEPITVVATKTEPATAEIADTAAEKATAAMDRARAAFRVGDYVSASGAVDEAIAQTPGDSVLHEFRSLTLFALGRFGDSAGVLHSVLASGPGWDWETMIGFYAEADRYTDQLRKLEDYVLANPDAPEPHFLLGYHYLVGENLEEAYAMFDRVSTLQPRDTVASQLKSLLADSAPDTAPENTSENGEEAILMEADKASITAESLHGIWKAKSAEDKAITLSLTAIGTFTWDFEGATSEVLGGEWSVDEDGLLVLAAADVQMVGDISLNEDGSLHFLLAGSPEGDPGLTFRRE